MAESQNCPDSFPLKLTSEQKEYAAKVLNESDEGRENAISEIKRWIQESDLRARTDELFILRFLRACKFDMDKTKTKIKNYQKQRANLSEWYGNRDPLQQKLQELLDLGICLPLRKLDNQGRMVIVARLVHDPKVFTLSEVIKVSTMIADVVLRNSVEASVYGLVIIIDLEHASLRHVPQASPTMLMNIVHALQRCYPIRIQVFNFINTPEYAKLVLPIIRSFLSKKLKERFFVHWRNSAHDCLIDVPANILPVEYVGTDGTIQELIDYWKKMIEENREWFIEDENYKPILKS